MKASQVTEDILGYGVRSDALPELLESITSSMVKGQRCRWLACLNPHSVVSARDDANFEAALRDADWLIPDGAGIVLASRLLGGALADRVTGSDIFSGLNSRMNALGGMSCFFLGSTEETLLKIARRMRDDYPNVKIAGTFSPAYRQEFTEEDNAAILEAVNAARPDVLWVGLTAPKQEKWIFNHRNVLNVTFAAGVGAVFDFYAGNVTRSSPFFQKYGLEWLPRLLQEPRRLWRRNFISTPLFLLSIFKQALSDVKRA